MGFMDDIFGGREKVSTLTKPQTGVVNTLSRKLKNILKNDEAGPVYEGQIAPGVNANMLAAFEGAGQLGQNTELSGAISRLLSDTGESPGVEDYYQRSVVAPARQEFNDALRQVDARYGDTWGQTGGHQQMVAEAASRFGTGIGSVLGELVYNDQQAALDRQLDRQNVGIQGALGQSQDERGRLSTMLGIGDYERGIEGENLAEDYAKWEQGQVYNNPWFGFLGPAIGTQTFGYGEKPGLLQQVQAGTQAIMPFFGGL